MNAEGLNIAWEYRMPIPLHLAGFRNALRRAWKIKYGVECMECGNKMEFESTKRKTSNYATIDHILARGLGGNDELKNLRIICYRCNNKKGKIEQPNNKKNSWRYNPIALF